ncbi:MAG: Gldg family protein [Pegethrix bostrychoides GSE-TBD4-15B]|jgi:ABC-type uncharacterized transport system involved in gliding motility auxiliary subunit|uniref:Gldg family protein n=1 Tax=Pegethrix bostrychoides GSE-TBD4-15B TaxID=2839662 RepID=A0A951P6X7_9CYAN|nr:Gldg family protein [Pegethrix bostrychoides GSE-TBD4-15B]
MKLTSPSRSLSSFKKYAKYLLWLALCLVIAGLTAGAIAGWTAAPITIVLAGLVALIGWLILGGYAGRSFWSQRSTQVGTNAVVATLSVLLILGFVNFLGTRYSSQIDLTENQLFTLAPQTQQVLGDLKQPVKAWIFTPSPSPIDRQLLDNYRRETSQFSYEFVDPQAKPGVAREFGVQQLGELYLETDGKRRLVQTVNPQEKLSERKLTNGIAQADSQPRKVYFLQGHGERGLEAGQGGFSQVQQRLSEESLTAEPLNLAENPKIPEDASVVVMAGAQRGLLPSEVTALEDYLKRKSGLMMLIDPQTDPNLDGLLKPWGVTLSDRLVIDPAGEQSGLGAGVVIISQYGEHPITQGFKNGISFFPLARPLQISPVDQVQATALLTTSAQTQAQQIEAGTGAVKADPADPKGPFDMGAAFSRTVETPEAAKPPEPSPSPSPSPDEAEKTQPEARLVVIGSSSFATDGLFDQQLNGDLFLNAVSWLSQQDDQVLSIRPKEMTNRRIVMSGAQQISSVLLALVLLPLLGFGTAALIWWRRR